MSYQYYNGYQNPYMQYPQQQYQQMQQMYPQQMYQQQQMMQQQMQNTNQNLLNGQMVDSVEVVKAKDVDLSGNPVFYPNVDGKEIYKKQLMADGTAKILVYKLQDVNDVKEKQIEQQPIDISPFTESVNNMKSEIIEEIRSIFG